MNLRLKTGVGQGLCSFMTDKAAPQVTLSKFCQVSSTIIRHVVKASVNEILSFESYSNTTAWRSSWPYCACCYGYRRQRIIVNGCVSNLSQTSLMQPLLKKTVSWSGEPKQLQRTFPSFLKSSKKLYWMLQINLYLETSLQSAYREHHSADRNRIISCSTWHFDVFRSSWWCCPGYMLDLSAA